MSFTIKLESGFQLLARLAKKQDLHNFYSVLFENGLKHNDVVEISSESNNCKSLLLIDMVCEAICPVKFGGLDTNVLVFNTDGNFNLDLLIDKIKLKINIYVEENESSRNEILNNTTLEVLENLFFIEICNGEELYTTIENLENILNVHVTSIIIFDTLTAYYWSEQDYKINKMDLYLKNIINTVQRITKPYKNIIIYTKPEYFTSKTTGVETYNFFDYLTYKVCISLNKNTSSYEVTVRTLQSYFKKVFCIQDGKINWSS